MLRSALSRFAITACLFGQAVLLRADFKVPPLQAPVNDTASMLDAGTVSELNAMLRQLRDQGGSQIAVLTVPDLGGLSIEEASIQVTDRWKLGDAKKDNGVLLLIAKSERKMRIEVGQGLEGELTDAYCGRIIQDVMRPLMREGRSGDAVRAAIAYIVKKSDPDAKTGLPDPEPVDFPWGMLALVIMLLFLGFIRLAAWALLGGVRRTAGRRGGNGYWGGGGFGGGSGGSFGGGGFSGGGGGFSGGGASGGW